MSLALPRTGLGNLLVPGTAWRAAAWLSGLIVVGAGAAAWLGAVPISLSDWLGGWAYLHGDTEGLGGGAYVLWNLRLPRILFALLIGAALGLSGALTQGLFRNPLADPGLLGVSSGAACAVALTIVLLGSGLGLPATWRYWALPAAAFLGAIGVCLLLDKLARWLSGDAISGLLLTGIALNALAASVIGLCTYLATDEQLRNLSFWTLGSLAGANWGIVLVLGVMLALACWHATRLAQAMNALSLGEDAAAHVGIDVRRLRTQVVVAVALLSGFAVAWCGMIGFIGLVAPHMVRTAWGPDHRLVTPLSMGVGALLLLLADTAARTLAVPAEIPVGIFTALIGTPFFLALLSGVRRGR